MLSKNDLSTNPIDFYQAAIATEPTVATSYWQLGIAYLLADRTDEAQNTWAIPFVTIETNVDLLENLIDTLTDAANDRTNSGDFNAAWLLRQQIWILAPDRIENSLHLIRLANLTNILTPELLVELQIAELLADCQISQIDDDLLERVLGALIKVRTDLSLKLIEQCLKLTGSARSLIINKLISAVLELFDKQDRDLFLIVVIEIANHLQPDAIDTLQCLSYLYSGVGRYPDAIDVSERYCQLAPTPSKQLFGSYQLQRVHFTAGNWQVVAKLVDRHRQLLVEAIETSPQNLDLAETKGLLMSSFFLPYVEDNPRVDKLLQNQIAALYQQNIPATIIAPKFEDAALAKLPGCLRIGYVASTLKQHSVGWLSRWLLHHHDRQSFQVFLYCININADDGFNNHWFRDKADITSYFNASHHEIVAQIRADDIDILVDLDSLTLDVTCLVMAAKPAPVQVSWLGWDSSGIPAIDYFIADPYVLPDDAQTYYAERIWLLPQTYLAVDGFEVATPTLNRKDLDIPADAIVYFSGQSGYKRHPDCIKAQMEIIKAVPNSYFLIKGQSDPATIQNFFGALAALVGIDIERLRFLPSDANEPTHRANLAIADIVLDTFPYNGATTTLETLWMGIPMVTQVGQQFAARNSYTFMLNAGIEEGIAWSQAEYIEWGIKLGLDRDLRDKIAGKLRAGLADAPVWNAKQFTLDMEQAYREMWAKYQQQQPDRSDLN